MFRTTITGLVGQGVLFCLLAAGCSTDLEKEQTAPVSGTPDIVPPRGCDLDHTPIDAAVAGTVRSHVQRGMRRVEEFFGRPFPETVRVKICPSRTAFTATFPPEWGIEETQPWMVATGVADGLTLLSPRVWLTEAAEHDPDDEQHVQGIVAHELVHVFHGQNNPTRDFTGAEEIGWFAEGLAVHVSGQLNDGHLASPKEAVELGKAPERLATAWSGMYRYGVCGSLVQYIDTKFGRDTLNGLLPLTRQADLLGRLGLSEKELLDQWKSFVLQQP